MFKGFYAEPVSYVPDNMHKKPEPPKTISLVKDNLDIILGKDKKKKGYSWNYGETVSIPISVDVPIKIEPNAICSVEVGEEPGFNTPGIIGQRYYNLVDVRSWTLTSFVPFSKSFIWTEDKRFTFPENGSRGVMVRPNMKDKYILVEFLNFRGEEMFERVYEEVNSVDFVIDIEKSLEIQRGIYELTIYVGSEEQNYKKLTKRYEIVVR